VRRARQDHAFRGIASRIVNWFVRRVTGSKMTDYGCMLRAYRRPVVDALCSSSEISSFIPLLAEMFAGRVTEVVVEHRERFVGESKYSTWQLVRLLLDLTTAFTIAPLRVAMVTGFVLSVMSVMAALVLIAGRLIAGPHWAVSGVFTVFAVLFVFVGALLAATGLLGEYVGRIYLQVRGRPRFLIHEVIEKSRETKA
jgi:undecaprenyl-phosphate 4-deoxy-4-formamido-L-arabinose transferase